MDDNAHGAPDQTAIALEALRAAVEDLRRRPVSVDADQLRAVVVAGLGEASAPPPNLLVTAIRRLDRIDARLDSLERAVTGADPAALRPASGQAGDAVVAQPLVLPAADPEALADALARRLAAAYEPAALSSGIHAGAPPWLVADVVATAKPLVADAARLVLEGGGREPSEELITLLVETAQAALDKAGSALAPLADLAPPLIPPGALQPDATGGSPGAPTGAPAEGSLGAVPLDARLVADAVATRVVETVRRTGSGPDPAVLASAVATEVVRRLGALPAATPPGRGLSALPVTTLLEAVARLEAEIGRAASAPEAVVGALGRLEAGVGALAAALEEDRLDQERALRAGLEEAGAVALAHARGATEGVVAVEARLAELDELVRALADELGRSGLRDTLRALGSVAEETRSGVLALAESTRAGSRAAGSLLDEALLSGLVQDVAAQRVVLAEAVAEIRSIASKSDAFRQIERRVSAIESGVSDLLQHAVALLSGDPSSDAAVAIARQDERLSELMGDVSTLRSTVTQLQDVPAALERNSGRLVAALPDAVATTVAHALDPLLDLVQTRQLNESTSLAAVSDRLRRLEERISELVEDPRGPVYELLEGRFAALEAAVGSSGSDELEPASAILARLDAIDHAVLALAGERGPFRTVLERIDALEHAALSERDATEELNDPEGPLTAIAIRLSAIEAGLRSLAGRDDLAERVVARLDGIDRSIVSLVADAPADGLGTRLDEIAATVSATRLALAGVIGPDGGISALAAQLADLRDAAGADGIDLHALASRLASLDDAFRGRPDPAPALTSMAKALDALMVDLQPGLTAKINDDQGQVLRSLQRTVEEIGDVGVRIAQLEAATRNASAATTETVVNAAAAVTARLDEVAAAARRGDPTAALEALERRISDLNAEVSRLAEHDRTGAEVDLGPVVRLLEAIAVEIDLLPPPTEPAAVVAPLAEQLAGLERVVREQADPTHALNEALSRLADLHLAVAELGELRDTVSEVMGGVDALGAAVAGVRARVDATAGVIDVGRRAADAAEVAAAGLASLRDGLVDLGAGSARTTDAATARLAALIETSVIQLTERLDHLSGLIERR